MIASLKRQGLYEVSIGLGAESFESENDWLNECDADLGTMLLAISLSLCYLKRSIEFPKDLWTKLDKTFGKHNEDNNITLDITSSTTRVIYSKLLASNLSVEVVQDEEEAESST